MGSVCREVSKRAQNALRQRYYRLRGDPEDHHGSLSQRGSLVSEHPPPVDPLSNIASSFPVRQQPHGCYHDRLRCEQSTTRRLPRWWQRAAGGDGQRSGMG